MSRPRKPTSVLDARGYFKKHPDRKRHGEPIVSEALAPPPERLSPDEVRAYRGIAESAPPGVLTLADSIHVELTALLLAEMRTDFVNMKVGKLGLLNKSLGQMGMTPADRAKLEIPRAPEPNPFDLL